MSSPIERHRRLRAIFDEAVLIEEPARGPYLDQACADDPELRAHVIELLTGPVWASGSASVGAA